MRILLIDDEVMVLKAFSRLLAHEGDVTAIEDANAALDLLRAGERFDVIFCDMQLKVMDAAEFEGHLRAIDARMLDRLVIVSGGPTSDAAHAYLSAPGRRVVYKPPDIQALRALARSFKPLPAPGS
jgi:CheY-like chemotaxis protein